RVWSRRRRKPVWSPIQARVRGGSMMSTPLAAVQEAQGLVVQMPVADDHVRPVDAGRAVPVTEAAAGFLDDHLQGGHIPDVNAVLDHQLAGALGHEHEAVEVAEA